MNSKQLEYEIIKALDINSKVDCNWAEFTPNEEFKELKIFFRKLFKEYNGL